MTTRHIVSLLALSSLLSAPVYAQVPAPKAEPAPAPKAEPAPAPKAEPAPAPKAEPAPAPKVEPAPAPKVEPAPAPKVEPAPAPKAEPAPAPKAEPAPAPKAEPAPAPQDNTPVVASVGALTLTQAQLDELTSAELTKLREELKQKVYEVQSQAVERFVTEGALEQRRAQTAHADLNALIEAEAFASIKDATEEEAKAFFDENRERLNDAKFEDIKPRIIAFLGDQKRREAFEAYLGNLKKTMKVKINLEPPRVKVESEGVGFTKGPQGAPITIVEFADFECGYCSRGGEVIKEVMKRYPNQVRLVYRDFPLSFHQNAESASIAARCAGEQGKYWEMHEQLFAHQQELNVENYLTWATELGLNLDAFKACSEKPEVAAAIRADFEAGSALGVTGTPAFFVNGVNLSGARPVEDFVRIIDSELARLNNKKAP